MNKQYQNKKNTKLTCKLSIYNMDTMAKLTVILFAITAPMYKCGKNTYWVRDNTYFIGYYKLRNNNRILNTVIL